MYKCRYCKTNTTTLINYVKHCVVHSNVPNVYFPCIKEFCSRVFKTYSGFRSHVLRDHLLHKSKFWVNINTEEKLKCTKFGCITKKFSNYRTLSIHLKSHFQGNSMVKCPFKNCQLSFRNKNTYSAHLTRKHKNSCRKSC